MLIGNRFICKHDGCMPRFGILTARVIFFAILQAEKKSDMNRHMANPGKGKRSFVQLGSVIRDMLKHHRLETDTSLIRVWDIWEEAVGEVIAANTRPAAFKENLLIVNATSSSWLQQLRFLKPEIIQKINHALGDVPVKDIKFKIGPVE